MLPVVTPHSGMVFASTLSQNLQRLEGGPFEDENNSSEALYKALEIFKKNEYHRLSKDTLEIIQYTLGLLYEYEHCKYIKQKYKRQRGYTSLARRQQLTRYITETLESKPFIDLPSQTLTSGDHEITVFAVDGDKFHLQEGDVYQGVGGAPDYCGRFSILSTEKEGLSRQSHREVIFPILLSNCTWRHDHAMTAKITEYKGGKRTLTFYNAGYLSGESVTGQIGACSVIIELMIKEPADENTRNILKLFCTAKPLKCNYESVDDLLESLSLYTEPGVVHVEEGELQRIGSCTIMPLCLIMREMMGSDLFSEFNKLLSRMTLINLLDKADYLFSFLTYIEKIDAETLRLASKCMELYTTLEIIKYWLGELKIEISDDNPINKLLSIMKEEWSKVTERTLEREPRTPFHLQQMILHGKKEYSQESCDNTQDVDNCLMAQISLNDNNRITEVRTGLSRDAQFTKEGTEAHKRFHEAFEGLEKYLMDPQTTLLQEIGDNVEEQARHIALDSSVIQTRIMLEELRKYVPISRPTKADDVLFSEEFKEALTKKIEKLRSYVAESLDSEFKKTPELKLKAKFLLEALTLSQTFLKSIEPKYTSGTGSALKELVRLSGTFSFINSREGSYRPKDTFFSKLFAPLLTFLLKLFAPLLTFLSWFLLALLQLSLKSAKNARTDKLPPLSSLMASLGEIENSLQFISDIHDENSFESAKQKLHGIPDPFVVIDAISADQQQATCSDEQVDKQETCPEEQVDDESQEWRRRLMEQRETFAQDTRVC